MSIPLRRSGQSRSFRWVALVVATIGLVAASGCGHKPTAPRAAANPSAPVPSTPLAAVDFIQWCWQNRSPDQYGLVLSEDFTFDVAYGDSSGYFFHGVPWGRSDELTMAAHLFRDGTPSNPPATSITLDYTQEPTNEPDARPGMNPRWHRLMTTQVLLHADFADGTKEVRGPEYFYLVRGDSALIPRELVAAGVRADSTRWWIQRWVDGSLQAVPQAASTPSSGRTNLMASRRYTWADLKVLYR